MRISNEKLLNQAVMTGTTVVNSNAIWLGHIMNYSVQLNWTRDSGTLTGAIKIQVSNAPSARTSDGTFEPKNPIWTDLPSATIAVTDAATGSAILNFSDVGYLWTRVVYTNATGSGVLDAQVNCKGL